MIKRISSKGSTVKTIRLMVLQFCPWTGFDFMYIFIRIHSGSYLSSSHLVWLLDDLRHHGVRRRQQHRGRRRARHRRRSLPRQARQLQEAPLLAHDGADCGREGQGIKSLFFTSTPLGI